MPDFLIIGAGAAGCVLANRLSADPGTSVMVVEAGPDHAPGAEPFAVADSYYRAVYHDELFWPHIAAKVRDGAAATQAYMRAKLVGGGSSVNAMMAVRGLPDDFAEWTALGVAGWAWDDVLPFFRKLEADRDFAGPLHGIDGPIPIRRHRRADWPPVVAAAARALEGRGLGFVDDLNALPAEGFARVPLNNTPDRRVSAAMAYLSPAVRRRPNLALRAGVTAERLTVAGGRATGAVVRGPDGAAETIAARQVIVSAGALGSPMLLLRSGIGPAAALRALGIAVVADLAGVGENLHDHPSAGVALTVRRGAMQDAAMRPAANLAVRLSSRLAGAPAHDLYIPVYNKTTWHALGRRIGLILVVLYKPFSRGRLRLASPDPHAPPDVVLNALADPRDMARLKVGFRLAMAIARDPALAPVTHGAFPASLTDRTRGLNVRSARNAALGALAAPLMDVGFARRALVDRVLSDGTRLADLDDDAALEAWLSANARSFLHACGSCRMGAADDALAVLDSECRVRGVAGLRVVDASVMPAITRASLHIPTLMVAERAADLILRAGRA